MKYVVDVSSKSIEVEVLTEGGKTWVVLGEKRIPVELHRHSTSAAHTLIYHTRKFTLWLTVQGTGYVIHWHGRAYPVNLELASARRLRHHLREHSTAKAEEEMVTAYMPGLIVKVEVKEGQAIQKGDGLLVIDAMKMENEIRSPCDGVIEKVSVEAGLEVSRGQLLCVISLNHSEVTSRE